MRRASALTVCFLVFASVLLLKDGEAGNHYCIQDSVKTFSINVDADQPETLRTSRQDVDGLVPWQRCGWEVRLGRMTEPVQLVLQLRLSGEQSALGCPSDLRVTLQKSRFSKVWKNGAALPKSPLIVPVLNSTQHLWVAFSTGAFEPSSSCSRIELTITVARKGFSNLNMLLHRSRFYFISEMELVPSDLNGTGVELPAISGLEQLRELVKANEQRQHEDRFVKPLDLSRPFRVGVYHCAAFDDSYYLDTSNGSCIEMPFNSSGFLTADDGNRSSSLTNPKFAVLRVASTGEVFRQFIDVSIRGRFLLSFSELPFSEELSCASASHSSDQACRMRAAKAQSAHRPSQDHLGWAAAVFFYSLLSLLLVFLSIMLIFCTVKRLERCPVDLDSGRLRIVRDRIIALCTSQSGSV